MKYSDSLIESIKTTIGVDPLKNDPNMIRIKIENKLDEAQDMVYGHIGIKKCDEDITVTYSENNSLSRIQSVYNEFMTEYEIFLETI